MEGDPKFAASQELPDVPYHRFAELIGLKGIFVDNPDDLGAAWEEALAADRPTVLDVRTDPDVPPIPPHLTLKQVRNFVTALPKDEDRAGVVARTAGQALSGLVPHR
jgi:pyruvate dehydrogenase (quinone)